MPPKKEEEDKGETMKMRLSLPPANSPDDKISLMNCADNYKQRLDQ